ncbi:uncharacterized protein LOC109721280 [Ananas comosus]|uniref:Uncharacterized protein LOC109721280 n=1 Tax=Ananas comosus TaxID=4615 RepID=A0A199UR62_ANACO|nr:uncharacterized protein LOC109721280 [Ananas comosus]OAY67110.1 hypothetical protein ACMD2_26412 [Ananas comosus]
MGCCVFIRWPSSVPRLGYGPIDGHDSSDEDESAAVRVVVGKERRVFLVEPFVLEKDPFRVLMEMVRNGEGKRKGWDLKKGKGAIFIDVDSILFEHMLWLVCNECSNSSSSVFVLNLKEIIEFYSQDN